MPNYKVKSFAKINLGLQILDKRLDNFHNINSVFIRISLHDILEFIPSRKFNLECNNQNVPITNENTIYKAYNILNSYFPLAKSARNRRKVFNNKDDVFQSYKNRGIFSNIPEEQLKEYIDSIFTYNENTKKVHLNYRRRWEEKIYLKSLLMDMDIWNNIDKLQTPTYSSIFWLSYVKELYYMHNYN